MKVCDSLFDRFVCRPRITPTEPSTIIGANSCLVSDARLYKRPVNRISAAACFEDDCRTSIPLAIEMQFAAPNVDESTRRLMELR
jgi:hypothetical protein